MVYDFLLVIALWMATLFIFVGTNSGEAVSAWWIAPCLYLEAVTYYLYSWQKSGQTLGMRTWRIQLINQSGGPVALMSSLIRLCVAPFSGLLFGLGYLAYYWGEREQTWHDQASATYVVLLPKD